MMMVMMTTTNLENITTMRVHGIDQLTKVGVQMLRYKLRPGWPKNTQALVQCRKACAMRRGG